VGRRLVNFFEPPTDGGTHIIELLICSFFSTLRILYACDTLACLFSGIFQSPCVHLETRQEQDAAGLGATAVVAPPRVVPWLGQALSTVLVLGSTVFFEDRCARTTASKYLSVPSFCCCPRTS
ncbi:unnamed protein product, partial [Ectocarpus fasciculatus]